MLKERIVGILKPVAGLVLASFCLAAALSMATCSAGSGNKMVGRWLPDENSRNKYIYEYTSDGKAFAFNNATDTKHALEGRYTIEKKSKDEKGAFVYHVAVKWSGAVYSEETAKWNKWYALVKIDPSGKSMQSQATSNAYREEINTDDRWYESSHRQ